MLFLMLIAFAVFFLVRAVRAAIASLGGLPRSNADWIWY